MENIYLSKFSASSISLANKRSSFRYLKFMFSILRILLHERSIIFKFENFFFHVILESIYAQQRKSDALLFPGFWSTSN